MRDYLRTALRSITARPGLSATIVVTLAIGVGANGTIFSAVDAVLLKPLPYPNADRLVSVYERNLHGGENATQLVAPGRLEEWNADNRTIDGLAASYFENMTDTSGRDPERVEAMRTSPRFFRVLGVAPLIGRTPTDAEERFGGPAVVVISDAFWQRRFNRDAAVVGRRLILNGGAGATIVGVMSASFRHPTATTAMWLPTQAPDFFLAARSARLYTAFGRLKPGVSIAQARDDLDAVEARLGARFPATDAGWGATLVPLKEERVGGIRRSLWLLFAAVGLVLLAACGNVACLLLANGARRGHEIAVRFALGASRRRIVAELLAEGAGLATAGALAAVVVAVGGVRLLRAAAPDLPRIDELHVDPRLIAFTLAVGVATTVVFAVVPAIQASRRDPADALSRGGRAQAGGRHRIQQALLAIQVALAVVLLVGSGLLLRSFMRLQQTSPGFSAERVLTFRMSAGWSERQAAVVQRHARTLARLEQMPGVESAAISQLLPAASAIPPGEFHIVGRDPSERTFAAGRSVSAGYFRTLAIPILSGETCSGDPAAPPNTTVLVSRSFSQLYFPGEQAIGHAVTGPWMTGGERARIVGVVGDVRENGIAREPEPLIYWCGFNPFWPDPFFLVRLAAEHGPTAADIRASMREIEPQRAMYSVRPLTEVITATTVQETLDTILLAAFAVMTLTLAGMGLYSVLSQTVAERRREIGIRIALGAQVGEVVLTVGRDALTATAVGAVCGIGAAIAAGRVIATLLFGVSAHDPFTLATAVFVLAAVAFISAAVPARRVATVEPIEALRL